MSWLELFKGLFWAILRRKENKKSREELERESQAIVPTLWSEDIHRMKKVFGDRLATQLQQSEKDPPDEPTL